MAPRNLPTQITDPSGNTLQALYHPQYPYLPQYVILSSGGVPVVTNQFSYYNVTNVVVDGYLTLTNIALGLLQQGIRGFGSSDAATNQWNYDGRGFPVSQIQYTGTGDPIVSNFFSCNGHGQIIERVDSASRRYDYGYDPVGRPIWREVFDSGQNQPMFW